MHENCGHDHGDTHEPDGPRVVELQGVRFTYDAADAPALTDISMAVVKGERLGVLGPNGGGKSTLIRIMQGLLTPNAGSVRVLGGSPDAARKAGRVAVVNQRSDADLGFPLSVRQVVSMAATLGVAPWRRPSRSVRTQIDNAIGLVGLEELVDRPVGALSGGQLQRALIARAVATGAELLLLDEPTVGVDVAGQRRFNDLLTRLQTELGVTIVIVSHQLRTIAATCDRIACLRRTLHLHGDPSGLTPQVIADVFEHDVEDILAGRTGRDELLREGAS